MLTPFLLHTRYTEQSMNCFKIGCFSFEERLGLHIAFAQAAHSRRKPSERLRVTSGWAVAPNWRRQTVGCAAWRNSVSVGQFWVMLHS